MTREHEEILNDPANYAVLKHVAGQEKIEIKEASSETGLSIERLNSLASKLEEKNFIERNHEPEGVLLKITEKNRANIRELKEDAQNFLEEHSERIGENLTHEERALQDLKDSLERKKENASTMKEERKTRTKIQAVQNLLEEFQEHQKDSSEENLHLFSQSHRLQVFLGSRDRDFHSFNPLRKLKTLEKTSEILDQKPEQEQQRRFFGNRWISSRKLRELDGRV